jgi:phage gpG-like protein
MDIKDKLNEVLRHAPQLIKRVPDVVKVEGLQFIHDNFDAHGFIFGSGSVSKWPARKPPKSIWSKKSHQGKKSTRLKTTKTGANHRHDLESNRALLVKKGALRRSWDRDTRANQKQVAFTSTLPYAGAHNEGGRAGRGSGFQMPMRKMIGPSADLDRRIGEKLDKMMDNIFR